MEAEDVLKLYDSFWFEIEILKETPTSPKSTGSEAIPDDQNQVEQEDSPKPKLSRIKTFHSRSMSDSMSSLKLDFLSPDSVLPVPSKLQTILSGKEVKDPEIGEPKLSHIEDLPNKNITTPKRRRKKKSASKSLSDLEFEELKGFMDLGFVFSEEDKDSSLASIIPGLQRLGKKDGNEEKENIDESEISRPYLSEAWEVQEKRKRENNPILMNWRVPSLNNEMDVKDSLRLWAHTVASTVR